MAFESVATLLGIGLLGYWIIRRRIIPENILGFLSPLALDIALPSLVFFSIVTGFTPAAFPDWWQLPLWWILFTVTLLALTMAARFLSKKDTRGEFSMGLFFQNGLFFPIFVIVGLFGKDTPYLVNLFVFMIFQPPVVFSTYYLFFGRSKGVINWRRILNPILITTIIAMVICLAGVKDYVPHFIISIFEMLGSMALPLLMLILGGNIYRDFRGKGRVYYVEIAKFVFLKNIAYPLVFIGLLYLLKPDFGVSLIIFLQSAVPPITAVPILTERAGGDRNIASQFVLGSFIFSVVTIPAMVYVFSSLFVFPG